MSKTIGQPKSITAHTRRKATTFGIFSELGKESPVRIQIDVAQGDVDENGDPLGDRETRSHVTTPAELVKAGILTLEEVQTVQGILRKTGDTMGDQLFGPP